MSYAPAYPHDPIASIGKDIFMVRGSIRLNALGRISRNMAIVRHNDELTLINPIRVDTPTLAELTQLGTIKRIIRLGPMHGIDDPFYVDKFNTEFWCQPGGEIYPEPDIDVPMDASTQLPFPNASLFTFNDTSQPEACILIDDGDGLLLTCDAIQHYGDYSNNTLITRLVMPWIGFPKRTIVGPIWLKMFTPEGGNLESDFRRLAELPFDRLLAAHGTLLEQGAKQSVKEAVDRAFA